MSSQTEQTASICVVMAVYQPREDQLRTQLVSLAAQDHAPRWLVLVEADTVSGTLAQEIARDVFGPKTDATGDHMGTDTGTDIVLTRSTQRLDAVRAFELGLSTALDLTDDHPSALIALSDQDDIWHTDRLSRGAAVLAASGDVMMTHSDARLVDGAGAVLHPSMFDFEKRHRAPRLSGLLYRNTVTGMTTLMRRDVVLAALPFPAQSGVHFYHDLWLALVAQTLGGVHLIDAPLVDYRQHGGNAVGAVDRTGGRANVAADGATASRGWRINRNWVLREAGAYGLARYLAHSLKTRMDPQDATLRGLSPWLRMRGLGLGHWGHVVRLLVTGHVGLARVAAGHGVVAAGRIAWSARVAWKDGMPLALVRFDRRIYGLSPGVEPAAPATDPAHTTPDTSNAADLIDVRKTPGWTPRMDAEAPCITLLIPTLNPAEAFAGIGTAMDLGLGLAARGHRVRMIATDLPMVSEPASRRFVLGRLPAAHRNSGAATRLQLCCGVMGQGDAATPELSAHLDDTFIATAWWSAHVARTLIETHGFTQTRFGYLIQDYEPNFYAWGGEFADAMASYDMDILPVFNTTLLRTYFHDQGFAFANADALAFRPSIDVGRYSGGTRPAMPSGGAPRKLALYGRPEVARNMFPLSLEALKVFIEAENLGPQDIEVISVGMVHDPVNLGNGVVARSLGKLPWEEYPGFLLSLDLGLSLMYSPHPSHPPLEMAASGVRVVTNDFGPKVLGELSDAITSAPPRGRDLALALALAWHMGPVPQNVREIDLSPLGLPLEEALDALAVTMDDLGPTRRSRAT